MFLSHSAWIYLFLILSMTIGTSAYSPLTSQMESNSTITIRCDLIPRPTPYGILGQSILAFNHCTKKRGNDKACLQEPDKRFGVRGTGIWHPAKATFDPELLFLLRSIKPPLLRFPGGNGANLYDWRETIGPVAKRPLYAFGLDEFLSLCEELGADPLIVMGYFVLNDSAMVDLVEYLNAPNDGSNPNGGIDWAAQRTHNGHPTPYKARYFEFGNEVYHGDHIHSKRYDPVMYGQRYRKVRRAMQAVDPSIQLGLVLKKSFTGVDAWSREVLDSLGGAEVDFAIVHLYPFYYGSSTRKLSADTIFRYAWAGTGQIDGILDRIQADLYTYVGRKVPLWVTEYNGGFVQDKPLPYRHTLGNAILNADLLRVFVTSNAKVHAAAYHHFANAYFGEVFNPFYLHDAGHYTRRPNYLIHRLFADHLLPWRLQTEVQSDAYITQTRGDIMATGIIPHPHPSQALIAIPPDAWQTHLPPHNRWEGLVVPSHTREYFKIDFSLSKDANYNRITSIKIPVVPNKRYRLSAQIKTEHFLPKSGIGLAISSRANAESTIFLGGDTPWRKVTVDFQPPADAANVAVTILHRHKRNNGALRGSFYVKDAYIQEIGPAINLPPTPYLSTVATTDANQSSLSIIVINKSINRSMTVYIKTPGFHPHWQGSYWTLNGPDINSTNEDGIERVGVTRGRWKVHPKDNAFFYSFPLHSVTVLELTAAEQHARSHQKTVSFRPTTQSASRTADEPFGQNVQTALLQEQYNDLHYRWVERNSSDCFVANHNQMIFSILNNARIRCELRTFVHKEWALSNHPRTIKGEVKFSDIGSDTQTFTFVQIHHKDAAKGNKPFIRLAWRKKNNQIVAAIRWDDNSSKHQTYFFGSPTPGKFFKFRLSVAQREIEMMVNGIYKKIPTPAYWKTQKKFYFKAGLYFGIHTHFYKQARVIFRHLMIK